MGWSKTQARTFADRIRDRYGVKRHNGAWAFMPEDHKDAVVCREVLFVVLGLHRAHEETATVKIEDVRALVQGVRRELGLGQDED